MIRKRQRNAKWASSKRRAVENKANGDRNEYTYDEVNSEEEEVYLRSQCSKIASKIIDAAVDEVINPHIETGVKRIHQFLQNNSDTDNNTSVPSIPNVHSLAFPKSSNWCQEGYLPVVILEIPSAPLDRCLIKNRMIMQYHKRFIHDVVVCNIDNISDKLSHWLDSDEVLESIEEAFLRTDAGLTHKRGTALATIRSWAKRAKSYKSLLLVIDGFGGSRESTVNDLFHTLVQLRTDHGIPISVLLFSPPYPNQIKIHASTFSVSGLQVRHIELPSSRSIHNGVWDVIMPTLLSLGSLSFAPCEIERSFRNHHMSFVLSILWLKKALVLQTRKRGSHMSWMGVTAICTQEWARMVNYIQDDDRRHLITAGRQIFTAEHVMNHFYYRQQRMAHEFAAFLKIMRKLSKCHLPSMTILEGLQNRKSLSSLVSRISSVIDMASLAGAKLILKSLTEQSDEFRLNFGSFINSTVPCCTPFNGMDRSISELMLVMDGIHSKMAPHAFQHRIEHYISAELAALISKEWKNFAKIIGTNSLTCGAHESMIHSQYRRNIGRALDSPSFELMKEKNAKTVRSPYELYEVLGSYTSISSMDWFSSFRDGCVPGSSEKDMVAHFMVGSFALERLGIVRSETGENVGGFSLASSTFSRKAVTFAMD